MNRETVTERFLRYIAFDTQSDEASESVPSTAKQLKLAKELVKELNEIGAADVSLSETGYVYAKAPATDGTAGRSKLGFISHMDTSPSAPGRGVKPRMIRNYDGSDLNLGNGIMTRVRNFPELKKYVGQNLIVTDGSTLLGADDKAGVSEIMTMAAYLLAHPEIRHGGISIAFTPDEEIGRGSDHFDLDIFYAEKAYTVDGGTLGELEYENFNAASGKVKIQGVNVHPGSAKDKMVNACLLAMEFNSLLPDCRPDNTEGYEGFFHICGIEGDETNAEMTYIIRDHDKEKFEEKKRQFEEAGRKLNEKYASMGANVTTAVKDSYYNMKEKILPHMDLIHNAEDAFRRCGVEPHVVPVRGGTDGASLSYKGLPCPNLSTGGELFHGVNEFVSINAMEKMVDVLVELARKTADQNQEQINEQHAG
ncbi:MAG: peptidase T [Eubacterium sp.]|nr:peptidase T [Eubacterium sp.]